MGGLCRLRIASHGGAGASADLRHAYVECSLAYRLALTGRDDDTGVGYRQSGHSYNMEEGVIRNCLGKGVERDVIGGTNAWHADRVRSYAKGRLQMLRMHHQSDEVIAIGTQAKEYS